MLKRFPDLFSRQKKTIYRAQITRPPPVTHPGPDTLLWRLRTDMSRDMGCCDLLQAGLASPHPSPLEGSSVAALTGGTLYIALHDRRLGGEHPLQEHGGDACAATRDRKPSPAEDSRNQVVINVTVNVLVIETSKVCDLTLCT